MKQRIRVVGILREGEEVLFLKRAMGRSTEAPIWELPTGKIRFGEQPEEAMGRTILDCVGVGVEKVELKDVITFVGLERSSQLGNLYIVYEITLKEGQIRARDKYTAYKFLKSEEMASVRIDDAAMSVLQIVGQRGFGGGFREVANSATVYVDGASRGNPGASGVGYYIVDENGRELKRGGEFIGFATSRVAEYYGLKVGCEQALALGLRRVRFVSDSQMMVNQMNGVYKVKNSDLLPIHEDVEELFAQFEAAAIVHVKREMNGVADQEANMAIDAQYR